MVECETGEGQDIAGGTGASAKRRAMTPARSATQLVLHRRKLACSVLAGLLMGLAVPSRDVLAQIPTPAAVRDQDLARLFFDEREIPAGLELENAGTRAVISQVAGTFRNSRDAAQLLGAWGWIGNAYRTYVPGSGSSSTTPARLEISLHAFRSSIGAAYALPYFAHDRAVALRQQEQEISSLLPCAATVLGDGAATRFLRRNNLLVRVTVVMPWSGKMSSNTAALATATSLALAVIATAGSESTALTTGC